MGEEWSTHLDPRSQPDGRHYGLLHELLHERSLRSLQGSVAHSVRLDVGRAVGDALTCTRVVRVAFLGAQTLLGDVVVRCRQHNNTSHD